MRSVTSIQASFVLLTSSVLSVACNSAAPVTTTSTSGGTPAVVAATGAGAPAVSAAGALATAPTTANAGTGTATLPSTAVAGTGAAVGGVPGAAVPPATAAAGSGATVPAMAGVGAATGGTGASAAGAGAAAAGGLTWSAVYDAVIVDSGCVSGGACHQSAMGNSKLGFADPMMAYMDLINVAAMGMNLPGSMSGGPNCSGSGAVRVKPGDPDNSLLMQKLEGKQKCGIPMPPGGMLDADKVSMVRDWIKGGAKM